MRERLRLHYERRGEGPPLILLHGLFGSLANWRSVARELAGELEVFSVDLRNHGRSPHHDEHDYDAMAGDLDRFIDDCGLDSAFVLGHSMGGKAAMQLALTHPRRVDRLVVVDVAPHRYENGRDDVLDALAAVDLAAVGNRRDAERVLAREVMDEATRSFLLMSLERSDTGELSWRFNLDALRAHREELAAAVTGAAFAKPALFIRGADSDYVAAADEQLIVELFPRASLVTIEGARHWVHVDARSRFCEVVREFLTA